MVDAFAVFAGRLERESVVARFKRERGCSYQSPYLILGVRTLYVPLRMRFTVDAEPKKRRVKLRIRIVSAGAEEPEGAALPRIIKPVGVHERIGGRAVVEDEYTAGPQCTVGAL